MIIQKPPQNNNKIIKIMKSEKTKQLGRKVNSMRPS